MTGPFHRRRNGGVKRPSSLFKVTEEARGGTRTHTHNSWTPQLAFLAKGGLLELAGPGFPEAVVRFLGALCEPLVISHC